MMRLLCAGAFLFIHAIGMAQVPSPDASLVPDQTIKVSPLHLLNFYPTIEVSFEKRIFPVVTAQLEFGYVLNYGSNVDRKYQNKRGVKVKLEGRYYFTSISERDRLYYATVEPYANRINFDRYSVVEECFDRDCNNVYTRQYNDRVEYRESGVSLKLGTLRYIGYRAFFDFTAGVTLRNIRYIEPARTRGLNENDELVFFQVPNEDDRTIPSPCLGVRFGYRIK